MKDTSKEFGKDIFIRIVASIKVLSFEDRSVLARKGIRSVIYLPLATSTRGSIFPEETRVNKMDTSLTSDCACAVGEY